MELGDEVTWRATHFGVRQTLTSRITKFDRPHMFRDSMVAGAFRRFDHDHLFTLVGDVTVVEDRFDFDTRLGILGWLASRLFLMRHVSAFLRVRLESIKTIAESGEAGRYLDAPSPGATGAIWPFCKCPSQSGCLHDTVTPSGTVRAVPSDRDPGGSRTRTRSPMDC